MDFATTHSVRVEVHTPCSYPLASVVSNPLYKGYITFWGENISRPFGFICGWTKSVRTSFQKPWDDDSIVNTGKQWFPNGFNLVQEVVLPQ